MKSDIKQVIRRTNKNLAKELAKDHLKIADIDFQNADFQSALNHYTKAYEYALVAREYGSGELSFFSKGAMSKTLCLGFRW